MADGEEFPRNLVRYELALELALRSILGAAINGFREPDPRRVAESFFAKVPSAVLADRLIEESRYALHEDAPKNASKRADDETPELF